MKKILIFGDSMVKFMDQYLPPTFQNHEIQVRAFPGAKTERLAHKVSCLNEQYDLILVHIGTNNSDDDVEVYLKKFDQLFEEIFCLNPKVKVLVSPITPRSPNFFSSSSQREEMNKILQLILEEDKNIEGKKRRSRSLLLR